MTNHYTIGERVDNETAALLASDPVVWKQINAVLDA